MNVVTQRKLWLLNYLASQQGNIYDIVVLQCFGIQVHIVGRTGIVQQQVTVNKVRAGTSECVDDTVNGKLDLQHDRVALDARRSEGPPYAGYASKRLRALGSNDGTKIYGTSAPGKSGCKETANFRLGTVLEDADCTFG